jgi:adenosylcobinamide-GDP ribazoletransferase
MLPDVRAAFSFLTILPLGFAEGRKPGYAFAWFPLVGLGIGITLAAVAWLPVGTPELRAFLILLTWVILTGALHLDGLADSCDGLLATVEPQRRLEIMRDPRTGSWAVVGVVLLLLGKWISLQTLPPWMLILPPVIGRWSMVLAAYRYPYARSTGLGAYFREGLGSRQWWIATACTVLITAALALFVHPILAGLFPLGLILALLLSRWAAQRLGGGLTGDVYGALCEIIELACLLCLAIFSPI